MAVKKGLGRGLGGGLNSMIPTKYTSEIEKSTKTSTNSTENVDKSPENENNIPIRMVPLSKIQPDKDQPRKNFDEDKLKELSDSIARVGVLQPLIVSPKGRGYVIIAGERRWRAARMAGLKELPVIVRECDEAEKTEVAIIENIQRDDLTPMEKAVAYEKVMEAYGLTQEELAEKVSKSRTAVANTLRLLKLSEPVQKYVAEGLISEGHARALLSIENADMQKEAAGRIIAGALSVRDTEKLVKACLKAGSEAPKKQDWRLEQQNIYDELEEQLKDLVCSKVSIKRSEPEKGSITIEYYSLEELERITDILRKGSK